MPVGSTWPLWWGQAQKNGAARRQLQSNASKPVAAFGHQGLDPVGHLSRNPSTRAADLDGLRKLALSYELVNRRSANAGALHDLVDRYQGEPWLSARRVVRGGTVGPERFVRLSRLMHSRRRLGWCAPVAWLVLLFRGVAVVLVGWQGDLPVEIRFHGDHEWPDPGGRAT